MRWWDPRDKDIEVDRLIDLGLIPTGERLVVEAHRRGLAFADLGTYRVRLEDLSIIPADVVHELQVFPLRHDGPHLWVAIPNLDDPQPVRRVAELTGPRVIPVACDPTLLGPLIDRHYPLEP